jgi:hypothetical protein
MHTNPEVLALLALGEPAAAPDDRRHLDGCRQCRDELESLSRLISSSPGPVDGRAPDGPSEAVWAGIQAELGFIPVTRSWPTMPEPPGSAAPAPIPPAQLPGRVPPPAEQNASTTEAPDAADRRRILFTLLLIGLGLLALGLGLGLAVQQ